MMATIRTSVFLRGEAGGHKTTQAAALQARFGGEAPVIGEEGARSLQNHHEDESAPLWKSRLCKIILSRMIFFFVNSCSCACFLVCSTLPNSHI